MLTVTYNNMVVHTMLGLNLFFFWLSISLTTCVFFPGGESCYVIYNFFTYLHVIVCCEIVCT